MASIRVLGTALGVALAAGVLASAAPAAVVRPPSDHILTTTHFVVHYFTCVNPGTDKGCGPPLDYATQTEAGDVAAYAEDAYSRFLSWGLAPPIDDGDGHIDIYLEDLPGGNSFPSLEAYAQADNAGPTPSSGMFFMTSPEVMDPLFTSITGLDLAQEEQKTIGNELFVLFEFGTWVPTNPGDYWLLDGAAQWAAFQQAGYPGGSVMTGLASPDISIDCRDNLSPLPPPAPGLPFRMCDPDRWTELGYTRWAFFQLLANKYGNSFIFKALANGAAGQDATTALANAIASKGSSLASVYNEYATDLMTGGFGVASLSAIRPTPYASVAAGTITKTAAPIEVPVNHLSTRYVAFQRGDGDGSQTCYAATLSISVSMPPGTSAQPYFYWDAAGSTPQALSVSGNTASITNVPWDTCDWGTTRGWLSIPNASTSIDAARFSVTSSVSVDTNTPATAASAPSPATVWGTTVPVPTADVPPSIDVFGPEILQLSAKSPTIELIVNSSGAGSVNATLGAAGLGSRDLRAGNNDLRFAVSKSMLTSLRRSASAANLLTLTPMSPTGNVPGQAVSRRVVITTPPKPAKHAKPVKHKTKKK
jgi:hypothetical protein